MSSPAGDCLPPRITHHPQHSLCALGVRLGDSGSGPKLPSDFHTPDRVVCLAAYHGSIWKFVWSNGY